MKKIFCLLFAFFTLIFLFCGCKKPLDLSVHVSELRSNVYQGESENYSVKACYGFKENPFINDGKVGNTVNLLQFRLIGKEMDSATYSITFSYQEKNFSENFKLNPITNTMTCDLEVDEFNLDEFTICISSAGKNENVVLKSVLPQNTINYKTALSHLVESQGALINHFSNADGVFIAELYVRLLVKDNKAYWYIGIASGNDNLKALLIDGLNGEVLAIRDVF